MTSALQSFDVNADGPSQPDLEASPRRAVGLGALAGALACGLALIVFCKNDVIAPTHGMAFAPGHLAWMPTRLGLPTGPARYGKPVAMSAVAERSVTMTIDKMTTITKTKQLPNSTR
jgi:hypothetical protein